MDGIRFDFSDLDLDSLCTFRFLGAISDFWALEFEKLTFRSDFSITSG